MKTRRRLTQLFFLALTLVGVFVVRGNAERWCPLGGVETLYAYMAEGNLICSLGVSNLYILAALLLATLVLRRAFCSYVCPVGTISEWLYSAGRRFGLRLPAVRGRFDRGLALLKYVALGVILYFTWRTAELVLRGYDPCYALIGRHGEDITMWAYVISGGIALVSLFVLIPFCRWLCPFAVVLHPFSRFGVARVQRNGDVCRDCGSCARVCPMAIPVDRVRQVTAARCVACMECVAACPARGEKALVWGPPRGWGRPWSQRLLLLVLMAGISSAVVASYAYPLPSFVKTRGVPPAQTEVAEFQVRELTCRGRAVLLTYFLERDDELAVRGYLRIELWPGPGAAQARVTYDPSQATVDEIYAAITEPYFERGARTWRLPPFEIVGYDPLALPAPGN